MKGILNREDLDLIPRIVLIPVRADHLQRTLHRLGSRVAEKRALQPADLGQPFRQRSLELVIVKVGAVNELRRLIPDRLHDARMPVSQRIHADSGDEVEIALPRQIVNIRPLSAAQNQRIPGVVLQKRRTKGSKRETPETRKTARHDLAKAKRNCDVIARRLAPADRASRQLYRSFHEIQEGLKSRNPHGASPNRTEMSLPNHHWMAAAIGGQVHQALFATWAGG